MILCVIHRIGIVRGAKIGGADWIEIVRRAGRFTVIDVFMLCGYDPLCYVQSPVSP